MKSNYLVYIILLLFFKSLGQTPNPEFSSHEKIFGKILANNIEIKGTEYEFNDFVQRVYADTITNLITLNLKFAYDDGKWLTDDGSVAIFDTKTKKLLWATCVNYQFGGIDQFNSVIINTNLNSGTHNILDQKSGNVLWKTKCIFHYCDPVKLIGLTQCIEKNTKLINVLSAVDLTSGKEIWSKETNQEYGNDVPLKINDSIVILPSSGIHKLNINNGSGWRYDLVTGEKNKVNSVQSNIVRDNSKIYIASKDKLVCLNEENGNIIWSIELPKDSMSKSYLFIKNQTLYLVNQGFAYKIKGFPHKSNEMISYGKPFFSAYQLENGLQKFLTPMGSKDIITSIELKEESVSVFSKNNIMKYSLKNWLAFSDRDVSWVRYEPRAYSWSEGTSG